MDIEKIGHVARKFSLVCHPERNKIIQLLEEKGKLNVSQIHETMKMKQPEASHHLTLMLKYDILKKVRDGKSSLYSNNTVVLEKIIKYSEELSKRV
jgi:ArsR family transcriptional regulator, zinc-responsive transcriptional repressor